MKFEDKIEELSKKDKNALSKLLGKGFTHTLHLYKHADLSDLCKTENYAYNVLGGNYCILPDSRTSPWARCKYHSPEQEPLRYLGKMYRCLRPKDDIYRKV